MAQRKWDKHDYKYGYSRREENFERRMRVDYIPPQAKKKHQAETQRIIQGWNTGTNIWQIRGKYQGTEMRNLPLHYLKWIGLNFDTDSTAYKVAVQELERRASNTKG